MPLTFASLKFNGIFYIHFGRPLNIYGKIYAKRLSFFPAGEFARVSSAMDIVATRGVTENVDLELSTLRLRISAFNRSRIQERKRRQRGDGEWGERKMITPGVT